MFEIKITADTLPELTDAIASLAAAYVTPLTAGEAFPTAAAAPAEDKPKRTRAKAEPAAAAAETPEPSKLEPADEGNAANGATTSGTTDQTSAPETPAAETASPSEPAGPTRDDALTAATKFSQTHGVEKLEAALEAVGAKKFSDVSADRYAEFMHEMAKYDQKRDVLS